MDSGQIAIEPSTLIEIVQNLSGKLRAYYVFPDIAEKICTNLQSHLADGIYNDITESEFLALALTIHMQEAAQDKHLYVRWHPESLPDHDGPLHQNHEWQDERRKQAQLDNHGLHRVERLPGNVGYLDIREFYNSAWGGDTAAAALNFLADTSALIVDLRNCRGGDPDMIALICSYLFGEERVQLSSLYWREDDATVQYWTFPVIPGKRFGHKPVYILTGKETFSGGEAFAYDLQALQRATLVGERTAGGAHPGSAYRLHPHFEVFIPNGRAINPVTGTNWEGCGVTPDVPVAQEQAFKVAYKMALESILLSLGGSPSGAFKSFAEEIKTALKGLDIT